MMKNLLLGLLCATLLAGFSLGTTKAIQQEMHYTRQEQFKKKKKKKKKSVVSHLLAWVAGGVMLFGGIWMLWPKPTQDIDTTEKELQRLITSINKVQIEPYVIIRPESLLTQHADTIKKTELNYGDATLFDSLGLAPDEVLLMNAANATMAFGQGGTNGALSKLIKALTGKASWGIIKDLKGTEIKKGTALKVGEVRVSETQQVANKPRLRVVHVLGPDKVNTEETRSQLREGMKNAVRYALDNQKPIVCCAPSTAIYAKDEKMKNDMYCMCWLGIEKAVKAYLNKNSTTILPTSIYLNLFPKKVVQYLP